MKFLSLKQVIVASVFITAILTLTQCSHYYYAPNSHNVPLFEEEGEARAMVALSTGEEASAIEFQTAYALTNHIGLMANGYYSFRETSSEYGKGPYVELGSGYFRSLNDLFIVEGYGGVGWGKSNHLYNRFFGPDNLELKSSVSFSKLFVQPSIGLTTKGFDLALSTKFSALNFNTITYDDFLYESVIYDLEYIKDHKFSVLFEPALTIRGGWEFLKLQLQGGLSLNMTNPDLAQEAVNISLGVYITAGKR